MKTKIVIELESANEKLVKAASLIMVDHARTAMKYFAAVTGEEMDFNIVHDGKNVTEIIQ